MRPHHMLAPMFVYYSYMPSDFLYDRNIKHFRDTAQKIINERRQGLSKSSGDAGDLLSILLTSEFYK